MGYLRCFLYAARNKIVEREMGKAIQLKNQKTVKVEDIVSIATSFHLYLKDRTNAARRGQMMGICKYDPMKIFEVQQKLEILEIMCEGKEYVPDEYKFVFEDINPEKYGY